ncbi:MAG: zinc-ribbon domain containing protein [Clostridia bacterium]|nr:zinc-ribbon domain containing protein [Clostridia bacterium]
MNRRCVQCGKEFVLTDSEISFYKSKNLSLPKRCKDCRDANRKTNAGLNLQNTKKNYNKDITVDTKTVKSNNQKGSNLKLYITILVVLVVGIGVLFSSFGSSDDKSNKNIAGNYQSSTYNFASHDALIQHFNKHRNEFGYTTPEQYLQGANAVINNSSSLTRTQDDGDTAYYLQATDEFVVVSPSGVIRTYFKPGGIDYFYRQQIFLLNMVA